MHTREMKWFGYARDKWKKDWLSVNPITFLLQALSNVPKISLLHFNRHAGDS